jgi:hypothetical protein
LSIHGTADGEREFPAGGACPTCGFRPETVPPADALVAVRSFPRRYRALLGGLGDDPDADMLTRRAPGGWSALEHAGHVRDVLHAVDMRLQRVLREDEPVLPQIPQTPPAGVHEQGPELVLAALAANAEQLARTMADISGKEWARSGTRDGRQVGALDLAREAVHAGAHHLREAERVIAAVRGRPVS